MRYPVVTLAVTCLAILIANGQFNYGSRNVFGRSPPPFFPPQTPASFGYPGLGGFGVCTPYPNYQSHGRNFWISWRGCATEFRGDQIREVCASGGMLPASLNDPHLAEELFGLASYESQRYFWTGGIISGGAISWPNGITQSVYELGDLFSHTGGNGFPQPDNREGNEFCLAVLNNFYNDGVRFHDVSCHHLKPIICEAYY